MTRKTTLSKNILYIFILLTSILCNAQKGIVTGTLTGKDKQPLPGVSITIKGQSTGTVTDFDGYYSLECQVGDILQFINLGFKTREVNVTGRMFDKKINSLSLKQTKTVTAKKEAVKQIISDAYTKALKKNEKKTSYIKIKENSTHTRQGEYFYLNLERLKKIKIDTSYVTLKYYDSDIFFGIEFNQKTTFRFVSTRNLHSLQTTFSQGPETNEVFSFGSSISSIPQNNLFKNAFNIHSNIDLNITSNRSQIKFNYSNDKNESIFGVGKKKTNQSNLNYAYQHKKVKIESFFRYVNQKNTQPNINGINSNIIRSSFSTPPSFDNSQGFEFNNGTQRSFNTNEFNNPNWLLNNNNNAYNNNSFLTGIKTKFEIGSKLKIKPNLSYTSNKEDSKFSLPINTVGFFDGYTSRKKINQETINAALNLDLNIVGDFDYTFNTNFEQQNIKYNFNETDRLIDSNSFNNSRSQNEKLNSFRFSNKLNYDFNISYDFKGFVSFTNHSLISSIQGNKLFQPSISGKIDFSRLLNSYFLSSISIASTASVGISESGPLLYNKNSHSSLILNPIDSYSYTANDELFINNNLLLEEVESYHFTLFTSFWNRLHLEATQYQKEKTNSIIPILINNSFELTNAADIKTTGYEASIDLNVWASKNFSYYLDVNFSTYKNEVTKIHTNDTSLPIAGFSTLSKKLIEGQPVGVIIGSAYQTDDKNNIVIGNDGYPLVSNENKIIGDPNPDFNIGITNRFNIGDFNFDFTIDIQKGGDVWNGTQQALNYLGVSEETAQLRNTQNFVFNGVTTTGENNTVAVNFVDPNNDITTNRWTRYGYTGIDEEAIVDGSYIHLKSIHLSYNITKDDYRYDTKKKLLKKFEVGIYANDLFTISNYEGATPYSNLFDTEDGNGLHFFNTPTISEVGIRAKIKF